MLNITAQKSAAGAKEYFARADYYTDGQELIGSWGGKGAVLLGLFGEVDRDAFNQLCDNLNPRTGERLTQLTRENRRVGYDFTWSAPKSVSVVHALTGDEQIVKAFRESISDTMKEIEADMQTRVRKRGGQYDRSTANLLYAEFIHLTSRPVNGVPCPQLHSHVFCFNATRDFVESEWKGGQFGRIKSDGYYWQAVQQARFASRLQELGYSIRRTKDAFEVDGIPDAVLKKFSQRSAVIEEAAAKLGITNPKAKAKLAATTREAKNDTIPYRDLTELWTNWLLPEERYAVGTAKGVPKVQAREDATQVELAASHLFERASVIDEKRLMTRALRRGIGTVTPERVRTETNRLGLLKREDRGTIWVTTKEILAEERKMIGAAAASRGTCRPLQVDGEISFYDDELDAEQLKAAALPLRSADRIMIIRGQAGTGKSRTLGEAVKQIVSKGKGVVMLAPSTKAVENLREDGFEEATTLARFLIDPKTRAAAGGGFILLDEAGMVSSKSMNEVFAHAQKLNARIVLLGDTRQLSAVERGSPLRLLEQRAGIRVAELTNVRRQQGDYRDAVRLLAAGNAEKGLEKLDAMGWVKLMPVWDRYQPLAKDYADLLERVSVAKRNHEALIVCPTHAEGDKIDVAVREELHRRGMLSGDDRTFAKLTPLQWTRSELGDVKSYGGDELLRFHRACGPFKAGQRVIAKDVLPRLSSINPENFTSYSPSQIRLAAGDLIRVTAKGKSKDGKHVLNNGGVYQIETFDRNGDVVLTNGWTLAKDFGVWTHAYSNTLFAAQGRTVQHVLICQSAESFSASSREGFYVAASRARKSCSIYTDDRKELRDAVTRTNPRVAAIELEEKPKPQLWRRFREAVAKLQMRAMLAAKAAAYQLQGSEPEYAYAR